MEEQIEMLGRAYYYNLFDNDRANVSCLYNPNSMMILEGQKILGDSDISLKLNELPFDQCRHVISTIDSLPSPPSGGILVFVSGSIQLLDEEHPLRFSQMFHLVPAAEASFVVQSDIFRLIYG